MVSVFLSKYSHVLLILKWLRPLEQKDSERSIFLFLWMVRASSEICYHPVNPSRMTSFLASIEFSRSVTSGSLRPHGPQHTRLPCPLTTPGACSNSCPLSQWCHSTKFPNLLLDKLIVTLINSFVYLSTVLTQMSSSHPFSGSSKRDWADTLPPSPWPKLSRVWCLRPTQQHTEVQTHLWSWRPNSWHQKLSVWWKMTDRVYHLPKLPTFPPTWEDVFCPIAHLPNNTPRSVWSHTVWTEQR